MVLEHDGIATTAETKLRKRGPQLGERTLESLSAEENRLLEAGFEPIREDDGVRVTDPSGNHVLLTTRA